MELNIFQIVENINKQLKKMKKLTNKTYLHLEHQAQMILMAELCLKSFVILVPVPRKV